MLQESSLLQKCRRFFRSPTGQAGRGRKHRPCQSDFAIRRFPVANDVTLKMKQKQYESTVVDFVQNQKGRFVAVTDDQAFLSILRTVLNKHLALAQPDILSWVPEPNQLLKFFKSNEDTGQRFVMFIERSIQGQDLSFLVRQFKAAYPDLYIIVLTINAEKQRIMYLYEVGADNFIAKPVSANTLIEKLAFTIKPQTKFGQVIDIARNLLQQGQPEKARQLALQILGMKPGSAAGLMLLGDAEKALGNMDAAQEAYRSAADNADLYLEPLRKLAELAGETGDEKSRLAYLEKLDELSPLNAERKVNMGEIYLNMGDTRKAEELFEAAVEQVTRDALSQIGAISSRISVLYAEKDPVRSEQFLRRALDAKGRYLSREDIKLFNQLGISLRQQGKWREAISEYEKAIKVAPDDENLYYNMGMAYAEGKLFREARQNMTQALAINDRLAYVSPGIAYNLGVVFLQSGAREQARQCLEVALELKPDMRIARAALDKLS